MTSDMRATIARARIRANAAAESSPLAYALITAEDLIVILDAAERAQKMEEALREFIEYSGGADNATEDEYVMDRARDALKEPTDDQD